MDKDLSDYSMQELFCLEMETQLAVLSQGLIGMEKTPYSVENLEKLMRASHSIKGAARIMGVDALVNIAHKMEDCFVVAMRQKLQISSGNIDVLLHAVDVMSDVANTENGSISDSVAIHKQRLMELDKQLLLLQDEADPSAKTRKKSANKSKNKSQSKKASKTKSASKIEGTGKNQPDVILHEVGKTSRQTYPRQIKNVGISDTGIKREKLLRVNADRLTNLMGLSSELLIETRRMKPFSISMMQLRRRYSEISSTLDNLRDGLQMDRVSEYNMALLQDAQLKLSACRNALSDRIADLDEYDRKSSHLSKKVYNELVSTRMRPFSDCVQGLDRTARDVARSLGKKINLTVHGLDTPVDREILEKIKAPLDHLVRNAIDHGIEKLPTRKKLKKAPAGNIRIKAGHIGAILNVSVEDDGQGVDLDLLKQKIIKKGLSSKKLLADMGESELYDFLFLPNFSTREIVTEISGRGVGLDVVRAMIQDLQGTIWTKSNKGHGLKINIQIPVTMSVISTAVVKIAGELYAFPLSKVNRMITVPSSSMNTGDQKQSVIINHKEVDLVPACVVLGLETMFYSEEELHIAIIGNGQNQFGVMVDKFEGQKELSVRNLDPKLGKIQDVAAAALSEEGKPILIIDMDDFIRSTEVAIRGHSKNQLAFETHTVVGSTVKKILFIDDSLTVRELVKSLLVTNGYNVELAVDGVDGWNTLRRSRFDLVITDVDMPRMDGIELVKLIKSDNSLRSLPVMIISYKDRTEDRNRGLVAGADYYFAKGSFQDELLVEAVKDLIGEPRND